MSGSPIITGLTVVFSIITLVVVMVPIVKVLPSRLEKRLYRQIAFHRDAAQSLSTAIARSQNDQEQQDRLAAQHEYHRSVLQRLTPSDVPAAETSRAVA